MNEKIALVLMVSLICFAFPIVNAQDIQNIEVVASEIVVADGHTSETLPSDLGGLISSFENQITKILPFAGINIFEKELVEPIEVFELFVVESGVEIDLNLINYDGEFARSEEVILDGRTETPNIWIINNVDFTQLSFDEQPYVPINTPMILDVGSIFINSHAGAMSYNWDDGMDSGSGSSAWFTCDEIYCPSVETLENYYPEITVSGLQYALVSEMGDLIVVKILGNSGALIGFIADINNDGKWYFFEDTTQGFSVESFEQNSLMLCPPGFYDIYVIV